jgi:outer membrane protein assembly factor BamB
MQNLVAKELKFDMDNNTATEYVTVSPSGSLIVADGDGMMVQEIDRNTGSLLWQFGVKDLQGFGDGLLHQPDKSFKLNEYEVLINDGNNRRVIIIDQRTDEIVWQYGETMKMGSRPGLLRGNTSVVPIKGGKEIIITDTLEKKIMIVDRATKNIVWKWSKPDAKWLQHVWYSGEDTFVMEDRQKHEVFEVNREGDILWTLNRLADGSSLRYPTDVIKLRSGNVLIAEAGQGRIIEVVPRTGEVVRTYEGAGFVTTIALDSRQLN